jgi:uncharacterized protein (TIGR02246 family)
MHMKRLLLMAILIGSIAGLVHGFAIAEGSQGRYIREDEDAIRQVIVEMTAAFNRHDPNASLFARDADFVDVRGRWLKGAAEIEQGRKARFETFQKEAQIRQLDMRIRFVTLDVAIAHVTNEISGMTDSDGTKIPPQRELNLRVFTKTNGKWLVTAFHAAPINLSVAPLSR